MIDSGEFLDVFNCMKFKGANNQEVLALLVMFEAFQKKGSLGLVTAVIEREVNESCMSKKMRSTC